MTAEATQAPSVGVPRTYTCPDGTPFPVVFDSDEQASLGWRWDQMHSPLPITPLSLDFSRDTGIGFNRAVDRLGAPAGYVVIRTNGYSFGRSMPFTGDPELRAAVHAREMEQRASTSLKLWNDDYRPEVEALTLSMLAFDRPELTLRQLSDRLDQVHAARQRLGELHHLAMVPTQFASNRFMDFCVAELGPEGERLSGELTQGFPNKSLASGVALWQLSRQANARPEVKRVLKEQGSIDALVELSGVSGGPAFLEQLQAFLEEYGWRHQAFTELALPSWREDPAFALFAIRGYLHSDEDASPMAMHERVVRRREERTAEIEGRLSVDPDKLATFREYQDAAQQRTVVLEDHNFYIDQKSLIANRVVCLALGERLAQQSSIDAPEDVFYLHEEDIQQAAVDSSERYQSLVAECRAERERWMHTLPPATIGDGTAEMPVQMQRFFGPTTEEPQQDGVIKGIAASAGVVRGTARLVRTLDEVERLSPGEILVTYATAPPWTPLFAIASAIVTDAGGMLSHCAVVAREYGIPAVVGSKTATARIPDGALITVDGAAGTVRIESSAGPASA